MSGISNTCEKVCTLDVSVHLIAISHPTVHSIMQLKQLTIALVVIADLSGCAWAPSNSLDKSKTYKLTVMHTNDHHGRFWQNSNGEYGMAARKTVVDQIRREVAASGGYTLLLDGGDVNTGVPESDLQDAVPDFRGMNLLGYQAMAVGNHEFDKPLPVLKMQRDLAQFPMLSANIYERGERMFAPYKIFDLGGLKVGVLGLTTEDTPKMVHPDHMKDIEVRNTIVEAQKVVPELRRQVDVVIAATHMGHYENGNHGTQAPGDVEMARAVPGIDMVVGGHSMNPACMKAENVLDRAYVPGTPCQPDRQNGTWIVQAHEWGKYVGRADFEYRQGEFKLVKYSLIPVNLKKSVTTADDKTALVPYTAAIEPDPVMLSMLAPYQKFGQEKLSVQVGNVDGRLEGDRAVVRSRTTNLGVLIGRAMMEKTRADLAVINAGGVRDTIPAGPITYQDILKVHPFGNTVCTVDLHGDELLKYLDVVTRMSAGSGAFPQFAGVQMDWLAGRITSVRIHGQAVQPHTSYRLALNNFQAAGGDGYPNLTAHPSFVDTGFVDAAVLRTYIATHSPLKIGDYAPGTP